MIENGLRLMPCQLVAAYTRPYISAAIIEKTKYAT